jgi:hypothetical protein
LLRRRPLRSGRRASLSRKALSCRWACSSAPRPRSSIVPAAR